MARVISISVFIVLSVVIFTEALRFVNKQFQKPYLQVQTKNGVVQGTRLTSDYLVRGYYYAFMGIPYAQPPIGPLRFRAPVRPKNWSNVLDASHEGAACVGFDFGIENKFLKTNIIGSEDCLFVNVFTKQNPRKFKRPSPVMVYIHGGAFMMGNSNVSSLGADLLVSEDLVVVTLNYRLGILGFLSTEDMASPGNYGLKDQNMALRWIQDNIRSFGGDSTRVTIFGHSAGASSVHFHILSFKSKGLFHRAIMESGTALCHWSSQRKPRNLAYLVGVANGITNPKDSYDLVDRLREISLEDLKISAIGSTFAMAATTSRLGLPYAPSIEPEHEDAFVSQDYWYQMLDDGHFNLVPVMIGITANESLFFHRVIEMLQPFLLSFDIDPSLIVPPAMNISNLTAAVEIGKIVSDVYLGQEGSFGSTDIYNFMQFLTHDYYTRPIRKTALLMAKHIPVYFYYFSYQGVLGGNGLHPLGQHKNINGVAHGEELMYLFNKLGNKSQRKTDYSVRKIMLKLWTNFAKYSNPTPRQRSLPYNLIWPAVSSLEKTKINYLDINENVTVRDVMNEQVYIDWWEYLFKKYAVPPLRTY